jgi:phospholipid/cholesterol/gamma-HCH transport system substrate-binding protein
MRTRDNVLVGVVIALGLVILAVGLIYLVRGGLQSGYPMYVRVPWGAGIKQGQTVYLSGADVGYVGDVNLHDDGTLIITLRVNNKYKVPEGTTATIEPNGFFGDVDVALRPTHPSHSYYARGDTIPAGHPVPSMADLLARADSASGRLSDVARTVQVEMVQGGGIADLRKTLDGAEALVRQLNQIATEQSVQLSKTTRALNRTVSAIDSTAVDSIVQNLKGSSANLSALTGNLEKATNELDRLLAKVDSGGGTAGKVLNDPALYNRLSSTLTSLDSLLADLRKNPKKYVSVHVF